MITQMDHQQFKALIAPLLPEEWFDGPISISVDDDEILVVGTLSPEGPGAGDPEVFREATRERRMQIAEQVQPLTRRSLAWGVAKGGAVTVFTSLSVPVMTRLRIAEREVLDTLVAAGAARSRSDALAWCVRFAGQREGAWLAELRASLEGVSKVRAEGPTLT
jgi:hypothetical protein